jgi:hypothetical protein
VFLLVLDHSRALLRRAPTRFRLYLPISDRFYSFRPFLSTFNHFFLSSDCNNSLTFLGYEQFTFSCVFSGSLLVCNAAMWKLELVYQATRRNTRFATDYTKLKFKLAQHAMTTAQR